MHVFAQMVAPGFVSGRHIREMCDALQDVESGRCKRLMIFAPPRHGKSMLVSNIFPAWCMGRRNGLQWLAASHTQALANVFSRHVKDTMATSFYRDVFPDVSPGSSDATEYWTLKDGGEYRCAGVGGGIAGFGADIAVVDDPFKTRAQAASFSYRQGVHDWFKSDLITRLMPGGRVVLMHTRWHLDDLAGRLLRDEASKWRVLKFPAVNPEGHSLWPEWFREGEIEALRDAPGMEREFASLYQQEPIVEGGNLFKEDFFNQRYRREGDTLITPFGAVPLNRCLIFQTADLALSENDSADASVVMTFAATRQFIAVIGCLAIRKTPTDAMGEFLREYTRQRACRMGIEGVQFQSLFITNMRQRAPGASFFELKPGGRNKVTRFYGAEPSLMRGQVLLPDAAPWLGDLLAELLSFPAGAHDDRVDALVYGVNEWQQMMAGGAVPTGGVSSAAPPPDRVSRTARAGFQVDRQAFTRGF